MARQGWLIPQAGPLLQEHGETEHLVVFVHGYFASSGVFNPMAEHMARRTSAPRQLHFTYLPTGGVEEHAERLAERLERAHPDGRPVCIVAHSLGGLIARYYAQVLAGRLDALVTMGTPHRGTRAAQWWPLQLARELSPESPLLRTLAATRSRLDGTKLTSVVAVQDALVPNHSAVLEGSRAVYIDGVGHHGMLYRPDAWEAVEEGIRLDPARAQGERDGVEFVAPSGEHPVGDRAVGEHAAHAPRRRAG